jgi:hypothetical protein
MSFTDRLIESILVALGGLIIAVLIVVFVGSLMLATQPETECPPTNIEWSFK